MNKLVRESIDIYGPEYTTDTTYITWEYEDKQGQTIEEPESKIEKLKSLNPVINDKGYLVDKTTRKKEWTKDMHDYTDEGYPYKMAKMGNGYGRIYPKGYKTLKVLQFIAKPMNEPHPRYIDIIKYAYELTYGIGKFHNINNRGYWSDKFSATSGGVTNFKDLCFKEGDEYYLNRYGFKAIKQLKDQLEKYRK